MNEKQMISKFDFFYNSEKYNKKLQNKKDVKKLRMLILSIILAAPFSAYLGIYIGDLLNNHTYNKALNVEKEKTIAYTTSNIEENLLPLYTQKRYYGGENILYNADLLKKDIKVVLSEDEQSNAKRCEIKIKEKYALAYGTSYQQACDVATFGSIEYAGNERLKKTNEYLNTLLDKAIKERELIKIKGNQ